MNRHYNKEQYLQLVDKIKKAMPGIALTTDINNKNLYIPVIQHLQTVLPFPFCRENALRYYYLNVLLKASSHDDLLPLQALLSHFQHLSL